MKADLHFHSIVSDGCLTPSQLVELAGNGGLEVIALTDHDSVDGIDEAITSARNFPSLKLIPGVEISTSVSHGEIHILGYFIDHYHPELESALETLRDSRRVRAKKMIAKLEGLGVSVQWERVQDLAGGSSIGRPHIAQAMLEKGYISSIRQAFSSYLGWNGPAYVGRDKISPFEAVELITRSKGLAVLAHPADIQGLEDLLTQLQKGGLAGIEAYYNNYSPEMVERLVALTKKYGLVATGGSDFHGLDINNETPIGGIDIPAESIEQLFELANASVKSP